MPESVYLFDTNVIAVLIRNRDEKLAGRIQHVQPQGLILPEPVIHEIERGLLHRGASVRLRYFHEIVAPQYNIVPVQLADWHTAATFWAFTKSRGRQLSDIDLLLGAMTVRLGGILVTDDRDFAHLPIVPTENWLQSD